MKVGYSRVDITPKVSVPLGGLSNSIVGGSTSDRFYTDVRDPLYATCIALTDETDNTILLYHLDLLKSYPTPMMTAKFAIVRATGIPGSQIMVTSTHNHSGPDLYSAEAVIANYIEQLVDWMVQAAQEALADRKPAKMYTTAAYPENMNFCRHYLMNDGTYAGDNFGSTKGKEYVKHVVDADNEMQLIKFTREGGKDIVMMNWQAHPNGHGDFRYSVLSHVDMTRKVVEAELDCHFDYFLGASGNVNSTSRIKTEMMTTTDAYYVEHGRKLGQIAVEAAAGFKEVKTGRVQCVGKEYNGIKISDGTTVDVIPLNAFSFGDVAFVTAPYEMFSENGQQIKEGSPFAMTFVATCANGDESYIPSTPTFEYGGYEVTANKFVVGTAEKLVSEYISMLNQIHEAP